MRLTVVADDNQLDVSLPSHRPVIEYIDDVIELLRPSGAAAGSGWTLSMPSHGAIDLEDSLADHEVFDGALLHLTKSDESVSPPFVDDVLAEVRRDVDARFASWSGRPREKWSAVSAAAVLAVGSILVSTMGASPVVVAVLCATAASAVGASSAMRRSPLVHIAWAATVPAGLAAWCATESNPLAQSVVFSLAAILAAGALAAQMASVSVSVRLAALIGAVLFAGAGAAFALGANPVAASVWTLPALVVAVIIAPRVALASSGLLTQIRLSERMELAERAAVLSGLGRGRIAADVLVWVSSVFVIPVVATIALNGVWEQGLAAAFLVVIWLLRSRNFTHVRHVAPMVTAAAVGATLLVAGIVRWAPVSADGSAVVMGVGVVLIAVAAGLGALRPMDEVHGARLRRFLDGVDLPLAIAFVPVVFFAQGVYSLVWPF